VLPGGVGSGVDAADAPELLLPFPLLWSTFPRSKEMSQKGSMVVETHLYKDNDIFVSKIINTILQEY